MAFAIISDAKSMFWQVIFFKNHLYFIAIISACRNAFAFLLSIIIIRNASKRNYFLRKESLKNLYKCNL